MTLTIEKAILAARAKGYSLIADKLEEAKDRLTIGQIREVAVTDIAARTEGPGSSRHSGPDRRPRRAAGKRPCAPHSSDRSCGGIFRGKISDILRRQDADL